MGMSTDSTRTVIQDYDISFYRGFPVEIKTKAKWSPSIEKSDEEKRIKERKKIDAQLNAAAVNGVSLSATEGQEQIKMRSGIIILDCLKNSTFSNYRLELNRYGEMYVLDFSPKLDARKERFAGTLWIDAKSGWVSRG